VNTNSSVASAIEHPTQGRNEGAHFPERGIAMGAPNRCGDRRKALNNVASTFVNTVRFLPKDLRCENGVVKLASSPGAV